MLKLDEGIIEINGVRSTRFFALQNTSRMEPLRDGGGEAGVAQLIFGLRMRAGIQRRIMVGLVIGWVTALHLNGWYSGKVRDVYISSRGYENLSEFKQNPLKYYFESGIDDEVNQALKYPQDDPELENLRSHIWKVRATVVVFPLLGALVEAGVHRMFA
jgi:hypothetical protein